VVKFGNDERKTVLTRHRLFFFFQYVSWVKTEEMYTEEMWEGGAILKNESRRGSAAFLSSHICTNTHFQEVCGDEPRGRTGRY